MPSIEYDLNYLKAGVQALEDYLLSSDLYWPIGIREPRGETPYPRLTLGGILLAQARLHAHKDLSDEQKAMLASLDGQIEATRSKWKVAWGKKAANEFRSRLRLWSNFLDEYRDNPAANVDRYAYEASRRVQLHLLGPQADQVPQAELELLSGLDQLLHASLLRGDFIWDSRLAAGFPNDPYWYLYGNLKAS